MTDDRLGVLLINLGAPGNTGEIRDFLANLFADPVILPIRPAALRKFVAGKIASSRSKKVAPKYEEIGGGSPLLKITTKQAIELEKRLAELGRGGVVRVAMRYSPPFIAEALSEDFLGGVDRLVVLPLYPQYSVTTTGSAFAEIESFRKTAKTFPPSVFIEQWCDFPPYIGAVAETVTMELENFSTEDKNDIHIVFSAHSIPMKLVERGDPYPAQVKRTMDAVTARAGLKNVHLAFQSRVGPVKWLKPSTDETVEKLARDGAAGILVVPIAFVSDHLETLHEIDIEMRDRVKSISGAEFRRAESLNAGPLFIDALARLILDKI